jgi:hypothetical protein
LREAISSEEVLFEITMSLDPPSYLNEKSSLVVGMNEAALRLAGEKMWSTFAARAAERFEVWWNMAVPRSNGGQEVDELTETNGVEGSIRTVGVEGEMACLNTRSPVTVG